MKTDPAFGFEPEYRRFLDAFPAFVAVTGADGATIFRSSRWREFTGLESHDELWDALHPDDRDDVLNGWNHARKTDADSYEARYRVRSALDGAYRWVRTHTTAVRDGNGRLKYYIGVGFLNDELDALQRAESQFQAIYNSNILGLLTTTIDPPLVTSANDEFLRMIGYSRDDLEHGRISWQGITPPEWAYVDDIAVKELHERGFAAPFEKEYIRKDGSRIPVLLYTAVYDSKNRVIAFALDLTERNRATERFQILAELGRRLSATRRLDDVYEVVISMIVPQLADWAVINVRGANGQFIVGAARHYDAKKNANLQAIVGKSFLAKSGPSGSNAALESGKPVIMLDYPDQVVRDAVEDHWIDLTLNLHPHSSIVVPLVIAGETFGTITANLSQPGATYTETDAELLGDIGLRTAQALENARGYEAERALIDQISRSEREYRALSDAVPVIMWSARADGWIDWYNQRWYEYTGQTHDEASGWGWQAAHHPEDLPRVMERWPYSIRTGAPFEMEFRLRRYDGDFHTFLARAQPVRDDDGHVVRWYGSVVDIELQKEALERTRRVAETLQGVFLPEQLPDDPRLRIDAFYQAAETDATVGGDWFDVVRLESGRILFSIGDVAGHGLDASVIAGRLRFAARDYGVAGFTPKATLELLNQIMMVEEVDTYATAIVGILDADRSRLTYACAGHPAPILVRARRANALRHGGLPLGVTKHWEPVEHDVEIEPNDLVAFYTDGVVEFSRDLVSGEALLKEALETVSSDPSFASPAEAVRTKLLGSVEVPDDAALLLVYFAPSNVPKAQDQELRVAKRWRFHSSDAHLAHMSRHELMNFVRDHSVATHNLFNAELILGELLANTVEHAPGLVEIEVAVHRDCVIFTVDDDGPGYNPSDRDSRDLYDEDGRGLMLVSTLARSFTYTALPHGGTRFIVTVDFV